VLPLLSSRRQAGYSYGGGLQEGRKMKGIAEQIVGVSLDIRKVFMAGDRL